METEVLIIGSGPAGYTAALYSVRAGLKTTIISGDVLGGLLTTTSIVENYPGFIDGIDGNLLMQNMHQQCLNFGVQFEHDYVQNINYDNYPYKINLDSGKEIIAKSIIICAGASHKKLDIESETLYNNNGISYCATCDGFFYSNKDVIVVGGGDSACEEALHLANICNSVKMLVRNNTMRASNVMAERVLNNSKIEVIFNQEIDEFLGNGKDLSSIKTKDGTIIPCQGAFIAIGHVPNSDNMIGIGKNIIERDNNKYISTKETKTNIEGVYAAGDIQDHKYRQAITSAGSGCMAAINAKEFLQK